MHTKNYTRILGNGTVIAVTRYEADEGKLFFDGESYAKVVDDVTGYAEVDEPSEEDATAEDYVSALRELGVEE